MPKIQSKKSTEKPKKVKVTLTTSVEVDVDFFEAYVEGEESVATDAESAVAILTYIAKENKYTEPAWLVFEMEAFNFLADETWELDIVDI